MIIIKTAIIYFSGTGNTEYAAKEFKSQFIKRDMECLLVDTSRRKGLKEEFDFYVFGGPTYMDRFPQFYRDWIEKNLGNGENRKAMIFSTGAQDMSEAPAQLYGILQKKGFDVTVAGSIRMPNNYLGEGYERCSPEEIKELKEKAKDKVRILVEKFLSGERYLTKITEDYIDNKDWGKGLYRGFSNTWAKDNLFVDHDLCVRCGKCAKNCPVRNITISEGVSFKDNCIYCQRCIHGCPVNAIKYGHKL